jgi:hypothetical protein
MNRNHISNFLILGVATNLDKHIDVIINAGQLIETAESIVKLAGYERLYK